MCTWWQFKGFGSIKCNQYSVRYLGKSYCNDWYRLQGQLKNIKSNLSKNIRALMVWINSQKIQNWLFIVSQEAPLVDHSVVQTNWNQLDSMLNFILEDFLAGKINSLLRLCHHSARFVEHNKIEFIPWWFFNKDWFILEDTECPIDSAINLIV